MSPSEKPRWTERTITFLTLGLLVVGSLQVLEMINGGKQTDKIIEYAKQSKEAAERSADAADRFAGSAKDIAVGVSSSAKGIGALTASSASGVNAARDQLKTEDRAWVGVIDAGYTLAAGQEVLTNTAQLGYGITNTGHSPAVNAHAEAAWILTQNDEDITSATITKQPTYLQIPEAQWHKFTAPPQATGMHLAISADNNIAITPELRDQIARHMYTLYLYGRIEYETENALHHTYFCYIINPETGGSKVSTQCKLGNSMD